jgi:predicted DCC family thiol-disulfide oxidoreductase YuxK
MNDAQSISPVGPALTIYFDGACHLCSREIEHYRRKDRKGEIRFVDISLPDFSAAAEGLDPIRVQQVMHVRTRDGRILTAVDAFLEIWKVIPGMQFLQRIASLRILRPFLDFGYHTFARLRPYLPKRKNCSVCIGTERAE